MQLPPEEPLFSPWQVMSVPAFVRALRDVLPEKVRSGVVAIDGRSASGKTTLAALLNRAIPASVVVHTDDLPSSGNWSGKDELSPPQTEATRRSFYDWTERLLVNVLEPARAGQTVKYRPLAWTDWFRAEGAIEVPEGCSVLILEGVGAARRELTHVLDAVIWVQSDIEKAAAAAFWNEWMAQEFPFVADQKPWERANFVVSGTPELNHDPTS